MKDITAAEITTAVAGLVRQASFELGEDVKEALLAACEREASPIGRDVLAKLLENAQIARRESLPLCQDCGAALFFLEIGQDVHIVEGGLNEAVAEGTRRGYADNYLRASMVASPVYERRNTGDNTPPVIHTEIVPGESLKISFMPKGGGAENMSRLFMLKPTVGEAGVIQSVVTTVKEAGGNPCPPLIIGLGIGATAEKAMVAAKKNLLRPLGRPSPDVETAALEKRVLEAVNRLGIGPLGMGGTTTALAVHAEALPCHFASLPVAVNLQCHSARHAGVTL
jgi:fumarate hydratase subunit alpha